MTTLYLIRHSVRMKKSLIEEYKTNQSELIKNEKIILSPLGEKRAELLANKEEFNNIDKIFSSNCVRTLQTAKYLMDKYCLGVSIDDRLDERRVGIPNDKEYPNWFELQFIDENYKTINGESQKEVRNRMDEVINEILTKYKDKRICVFSHGYAMLFYLMKYCELIDVNRDKIILKFNNKIIFDRYLNAPEVFKLTFNNKKIENIELIEFEDIEYNLGI